MSRLLIYNQKSCLNAISFLFFPFTLHFSQSIAHLELQGLRKCLYFTNTSVSDPHRSLFVWTSLHSLPSILLRLFVRYDASRGERVRDGGSLSPRRIHDESSVLASGIPRLQTHRETSSETRSIRTYSFFIASGRRYKQFIRLMSMQISHWCYRSLQSSDNVN